MMMLAIVVGAILAGLALRFVVEFLRGLGDHHKVGNIEKKGRKA